MNVIERINELRTQHGWSVNYLALEAGMTQSTLNSILQRNSNPKIETLQSLCDAFGITLSQFFSQDENSELLSVKEKQLIIAFRNLSPKKQKAVVDLISKDV